MLQIKNLIEVDDNVDNNSAEIWISSEEGAILRNCWFLCR